MALLAYYGLLDKPLPILVDEGREVVVEGAIRIKNYIKVYCLPGDGGK